MILSLENFTGFSNWAYSNARVLLSANVSNCAVLYRQSKARKGAIWGTYSYLKFLSPDWATGTFSAPAFNLRLSHRQPAIIAASNRLLRAFMDSQFIINKLSPITSGSGRSLFDF